MTAVLIGSFNLGDAIPGLNDSLDSAGQGLQNLKSAVDKGISDLNNIVSSIDSIARDLDASKDSYLNEPFQKARDLASTATSYLSELRKLSPSQYLDDLSQQLQLTSDLLSGLTDIDKFLQDQISAVTASISALDQEVNDLQQQINDLTSISDRVGLVTGEARSLLGDLSSAANEATNVIAGYLEQASQLLNSGVYVVHYNGTLNALGGEVDAVLPSTGVAGTENVVGPLLIVKTADTATLTAIKSAFGITI
jgi:chromosome segregation ATPase